MQSPAAMMTLPSRVRHGSSPCTALSRSAGCMCTTQPQRLATLSSGSDSRIDFGCKSPCQCQILSSQVLEIMPFCTLLLHRLCGLYGPASPLSMGKRGTDLLEEHDLRGLQAKPLELLKVCPGLCICCRTGHDVPLQQLPASTLPCQALHPKAARSACMHMRRMCQHGQCLLRCLDVWQFGRARPLMFGSAIALLSPRP